MKIPSLRCLSLLALFAPAVFSGTARITFDTGDGIDGIDPRIYGVFREPIGFNSITQIVALDRG